AWQTDGPPPARRDGHGAAGRGAPGPARGGGELNEGFARFGRQRIRDAVGAEGGPGGRQAGRPGDPRASPGPTASPPRPAPPARAGGGEGDRGRGAGGGGVADVTGSQRDRRR